MQFNFIHFSQLSEILIAIYPQVQTIINSSLGFSDILQDCPKQLIHGDVNEYNIVVGEDGDINIIDFNDLSYCYRVFEVAHCIGYMMEAQKCDIQVM